MSFEKWVQQRLINHGADIKPDGDWGRRSISALKHFQRVKGLSITGVTDLETIEALRKNPESSHKEPSIVPRSKMPPWMVEMDRRSGLHEVRNNRALSEFLKSFGRYLGNPKDLPWCGDAIESCIAKTLPEEVLPSNPFWAQSWRNFGLDVKEPVVGSIGVIRWNRRAGHVGFVAGFTKDRINLLGGNQSNSINISSFPLKKFIAFRWPKTFPEKSYPPLKGTTFNGKFNSTR